MQLLENAVSDRAVAGSAPRSARQRRREHKKHLADLCADRDVLHLAATMPVAGTAGTQQQGASSPLGSRVPVAGIYNCRVPGERAAESPRAMSKRFAWIGVGVMGRHMASHLLAAGHEARVFSRTAAKCQPLIERGAVLAQSPREAAEGADVIFTMVSTPTDVEVRCDSR